MFFFLNLKLIQILLNFSIVLTSVSIFFLDFRFKKGTDQPKVARKIGQKRTRTMENFEHAMSQLGVDISTKKMKNLEADSSHPIRGKRIRVGRSQSLVGNTALPRDVQGVPDIEVSFNIFKNFTKKLFFRHLIRQRNPNVRDNGHYNKMLVKVKVIDMYLI